MWLAGTSHRYTEETTERICMSHTVKDMLLHSLQGHGVIKGGGMKGSLLHITYHGAAYFSFQWHARC